MAKEAILAGADFGGQTDFEGSMNELGSLAEACGIGVIGTITQKLERPNPAYYVGPGKAAELAAYVRGTGAACVVFNDELSPSQIRNLTGTLGCEVIDRTMLILDIFASRARTTEAKLQVETAHLQYMLPRLVGMDDSLEQQTGGVGTTNRGAGETQLELSRRQIQARIQHLQRELEELVQKRQTQRRQRRKTGIPVAALVGYTNAGKSTLLNALLERCGGPEQKRVLEKDQLFATLETSVRRLQTPENRAFLLTDTVGFIDRLPHHLVKAFRSTLEEVAEADLLIHVVDCSSSAWREQAAVTSETLAQLGAQDIPTIFACNKADLVDIRSLPAGPDRIFLSAKNKTGLDELLRLISARLFADTVRCRLLIPYAEGGLVTYFSRTAHVLASEYRPDGTLLTLDCRKADYDAYRRYDAQPASPGGD